MTTINLSGNQGQVHFTPGSFDLYNCDATFQVNTLKTSTTTQSGRIFINGAPNNARWFQGYVHGLMTLETEYSMYSTTGNGGAPFHIEHCNGFTIHRLEVDGSCWDPIRIGTGAENPLILECYIQDARDDVVEADHASDFGTVTVRRCFFQNSHSYISTTPGGSAPTTTAYRWVFDSCLLELSNNQRDSRAKRMYPWNNSNYGSGQAWKCNGSGLNGTMHINDCTLMWQRLPKQSLENHALLPANMALDPASGGNVFVWLGAQTSALNGNVFMVTVDKIGGGTLQIPGSIVGTPTSNPSAAQLANKARILDIYTFTDSATVWDDAEAAWLADVWGAAPGDPDEDPPIANDDTGFNIASGVTSILVPVLNNDSNVGASLNPVVTKSGNAGGPVTTSVENNQLRVTRNSPTSSGAWSQSYLVTNANGSDVATASGQVLAVIVPPPDPEPQEVRTHDPAWELSEGALLVEIQPANVSVKQGVISKDAVGFGDGHLTVYLENATLTARMQLAPDVTITLDAPGIQPATEYEVLLVFVPTDGEIVDPESGSPLDTPLAAGVYLFLNRERVAFSATAWDLTGNTLPLVVGGNNDASTAGTTDAVSDLYQGSVEVVAFLTADDVNGLFGASGPIPLPATSKINDLAIPLAGVVLESAFRSNFAAAKTELELLNATGTSSIDPSKPEDGSATKSDVRANFAAIKAAIQSLGSPGSSDIDATKPADDVATSRRDMRTIFRIMRVEIDALLAAGGSP